MTEVVLFFALLIFGSVALVLALNASYWAGQRSEEKRARRYLDSLTHLYRANDHHRDLP